MKYLKTFNESIRDKMTPKPKDDIKKSMYDYFEEECKVYKDYNITPAFDEMKFFDLDNLYLVIDTDDDYYDETEKYIKKLIKGHKSYKVEDQFKFTCYPDLKIAHCFDRTMTDSWYFDGSHIDGIINYIMKNYSVKDHMMESIQDFNPEEIKNKEAEHLERELAYRKKMRSEDDNDYDFDELRDVITDEIGDLKNYYITASKKKDEIYIEYESEEVGRVKIFNPNDESEYGYFEVNGKMHSIDADEIRNFYHYLNQEMKKL